MSAQTMPAEATPAHPIVSRAEWIEARKAFLVKEKAHTRAGDALAAERQTLPWLEISKPYIFDTSEGKKSLADLFAGRSQLIVYHFMLGPGWKEGCPGCSFLSDHVDAARQHFEHHDITFTAISRGTLADIQPFKRRMGWTFPWVSSSGSDFNYDFGVSFTPEQIASGQIEYNYRSIPPYGEDLHGISVFFKDAEGRIFQTYSSYARGGDVLLGAYAFIDLTPKGRNEKGANADMNNWMRHHDRYEETKPPASATVNSISPAPPS